MSDIIEITDFSDSRLDVYARLTEAQLLNKEFPEKGMFIAESPKVITRARGTSRYPFLWKRGILTGKESPFLNG